jgi:hypothetical protein
MGVLTVDLTAVGLGPRLDPGARAGATPPTRTSASRLRRRISTAATSRTETSRSSTTFPTLTPIASTAIKTGWGASTNANGTSAGDRRRGCPDGGGRSTAFAGREDRWTSRTRPCESLPARLRERVPKHGAQVSAGRAVLQDEYRQRVPPVRVSLPSRTAQLTATLISTHVA